MNSFHDFPPLPPLGSAFSPEPAPYDWQDTTPSAAVASAGYPLLLADSPGPPNDSMEEHDSIYDDEAVLALFEQIINSDCIQPETSRPGSPMLSGIINDALQAVHQPVTQLDTAEPNSPHHDNLRRASASPRARLTPASFSPSPARSVFAHLVSPPQERAPEVAREHDHFSPDALLTPTIVPEPAFPPYPFGPPYHPASPTRGYKRDRGPESAPRSEDRTSKRLRIAGSSSQRDRAGCPLGPIASSSSSSRLATSPRASVSNIENARTSPARSPLRIWGVPPSTPVREQRSVPNAVEDRTPLVARTNTPSAPVSTPTSANRSPLAARTNTPPSSKPAPDPGLAPLPTGVRTYLELAGYPEHVRDLPEEFYYDIRCIGAELVPQGLPPATWVAPAPSSVKSRNKGKGKALATTKVTKAKKSQKDKKKRKPKFQYFCPFYTPLESKTKTRSPSHPDRVLFTVASPNIPGAATASRLVSCTRREPFPRQADALRHALNKHIEPRTYCIERFSDADSRVCSSFNRPDSVKRHLRDTCMVEQFPLLVHDTAARLGLTLDLASPDPRVRTQSKRNWAACEALVARERTRIVMPCYQKPAVRAAVGTYLRWRGKDLEWFEEDQRAVAIEFERCPCAACQVPEQDWAEEWVRGRIDVPVWYGEQRVTVEAGVSGKKGRRRKVEGVEDDDEDDVDAGGEEEELEDHDADEDSAGPTPRAVDAEDDDRLSPEPEEGVDEDEDEDEAPDVLPALAPARPVEPAEPSIVASEERTLSHPAAQPGPSAHAQAAAPPVVQEPRGQSRPALDYAPSTSTPSRPVSLHTGVPWMESPLEVYQRIHGNVSTLLAPGSAVVASSSMAPPSPDDGVDWGSLFN